jgi:serine/threonine protein kinase
VRPPAELDSTVPDSPLSSRGAGSGLRALPGRQRCPSCGAEFPASYQVCPHDATPLGAAGDPTDPLVGVVLAGTYRLGRAIGRGGMGRLYGAEHTRLGRRFAVKVLQHEHAEKAEAVKRFEREAEALARIRSDFVLDVVDVLRTPDGRTAIVTALLEGEDLQRRLDRAGTLATSEALAIARQLCRGLAAAHAVGVVHRDLKPSNLFLAAAPDGRLSLKILDFGVAKLGGDDAMTRTGVVLGTPAYMPPEQARGSSRADPRSDVYGVGAVLYRMLTGRMPYDGEDPGATLARLLIEAPPRPRTLAPELPVAIEMLIQRAMARDPRERPTTALELESELAALSGEEAHEGGASTPRVVAGASRSPETLVLPYGAIDRAESLEKSAKRARPLAASIAIVATLAIGAASAAAIAPLASLVGGGDATAALGQALAIVGGIACAIAGAIAIAQWLVPRWSSAPAVHHATARLGRSVLVGLATVGAAALGTSALGAITGSPITPPPLALAAALVAAAIAATVALRRRA